MQEPEPIWAGAGARRGIADRVLAQAHLLAAAAIGGATAANVVATGWTYWSFAGPDGSLTTGERLRVALGAAMSPLAAALLVTATLAVLVPRLVVAHHRLSPTARALLTTLAAAQLVYAHAALIAVIDAFALFEPERRGRFDIPFGQTGPTRLVRVATFVVAAAGAALALAGRAQRRADRPMNLDVEPAQ